MLPASAADAIAESATIVHSCRIDLSLHVRKFTSLLDCSDIWDSHNQGSLIIPEGRAPRIKAYREK
jgi:hypothetical protein